MTTTVAIDTHAYQMAESYAQKHQMSVRQLFETYALTLISGRGGTKASGGSAYKRKAIKEMSPLVQSLIGLARDENSQPIDDLNARDIRQEYWEEKNEK